MRGSSSAPTARVLDVLELLADDRCDPLRYAEIAETLDLNQATTHSILKTLTDRGWLVRNPDDLTFSLGPSSRVLARTELALAVRERARRIVASLALDLKMSASVLERVGHDLVVVDYRDERGAVAPTVTGGTYRYLPPFGVVFAAWAPDGERREWVRRAAGDSEDLRRRFEDLLNSTRERGYNVERTTPAMAQVLSQAAGLRELSGPLRRISEQLVTELVEIMSSDAGEAAGASAHRVTTIDAPVLDEAGRVTFSIAVHPLRPLTPKQVAGIGRSVTEMTKSLSTLKLDETGVGT